MENRLNKIEKILLMGPGPSSVHPDVYSALSRPTLGHMDSYFISIMDDIKFLLQQIFKTKNPLTIPISGTGSAGMETCFVNLVEPGDNVLVLVNGVFGTRMCDVATRLGALVDSLEFDWGTPVLVGKVSDQLKKKTYKVLAMVHAETSTGVKNPAAEIGMLLQNGGPFYLLDVVTSLGGIDVAVDEWGVDAAYSGSQKCLSCPPGLSPVTFSERATRYIKKRNRAVPNWYLDMGMILKYWDGKQRVYHHTAPINMLYALYQSLLLFSNEGSDNVFKRHLECHQHLVKSLNNLGISMFVEEPNRLPMLNAVRIPENVNDSIARELLRNRYKIEIGNGLGPLAGRIWRIGLMGYTAQKENVDALIDALTPVIEKSGK